MGLGNAETLFSANAALSGERAEPARPLTFHFFPNSYVLAHVTRMAEVAKVLRTWGHTVVFCGDDPADSKSKLQVALTNGFDHLPVQEYYFPYFWDRFEKYGSIVTLWDIARSPYTHCRVHELLAAQIEHIREHQPDIVVGDGTLGLSTAAHIAGVKAGLIMNAYNTRFFRPKSPTMPFMLAFDTLYVSRFRAKVFKRYGLKRRNGLLLALDTPIVCPDLEAFGDDRNRYGKMSLVGPIACSPKASLPEWFDELKDGRENVYLTMGSTGRLDAFLRTAYEELGKTRYRFVVTTGGQVSPETMAAAPENFRFTHFAPGRELLKHCSALIYHGGTGSMYQALEAGVPMLAYPFHLEQYHASYMVEREGFGLRRSANRMTGKKLVRDLNRILTEPLFRERAKYWAKHVAKSDGAAKAAAILEEHAYSGKVAGY